MKRAYWNKLADAFESDVCDITREETADLVRRYVALARPRRKNAVLVDLGCGVGTFIHRYGNRFAKIYGVEFAPRIIARATRLCANMTGITWMTSDIPPAAKAIGRQADLTVCMNVITSSSAAKRAALWSSVAAVTRKGGYALVVVPSLESERLVAVERGEPQPRASGLVKRDDAIQKHYTREELKDIFAGHGFAVKRIGRAHYPWSIEGVRETKARRANRPWDWMCVAERV